MKKLNYTVAILSLLVIMTTSINAAQARHTAETRVGRVLMPETTSEKIDELTPSQQSETRYLRDMIKLHNKGIKMSQKLYEKVEHPELKKFLQNEINTQIKESEQLETWQKQWYGEIYK